MRRAEKTAMWNRSARFIAPLVLFSALLAAPPIAPIAAGRASAASAARSAGAPSGAAGVQTIAVGDGGAAPGSEFTAESAPGTVAPFQMLGVSWDGPATAVSARVRTDTGWGEWFSLEASDDPPEPGTAEARRFPSSGQSSEPTWVGNATAYEVQASAAVTNVRVHLVRTGADPEPQFVAETYLPGGAPPVYLRSAWGAQPATNPPTISPTIKMAFVHHTATPNGYSAAEVPSILRGIQAYEFAQGYSDIAYNFLVDRFGRIWEGRGGGIDRNVMSASTGGFNASSLGVAVIGDYTVATPSQASVDSLSQIIGWKLGVNGTSPVGVATMTSSGNDRYAVGASVTFNAVSGHLDAKPTACPGGYLYQRLAEIRAKANDTAAVVANSPFGAVDVFRQAPQGLHVAGWAIDPNGTGPLEVDVVIDGRPQVLGAWVARADIGNAYPAFGANHGFDAYMPLAPGDHQVCIFVRNWAAGRDTQLDCPSIHIYDSPAGYIDSLWVQPDGVHISGWTLDPDTSGPVDLHVHVDDVNYVVHTNVSRPDIGALHPEYGNIHGFQVVVPPPTRQLCLFVINVGPGDNVGLGCPPIWTNPTGYVDALSLAPEGVRAVGWALDPNTGGPTTVQLTSDGVPIATASAASTRSDVGAIYVGYGSGHGYSISADPGLGTHTLCVDALNTGPGSNMRLGCRVVTRGNNPIGYLDQVVAGSGGRRAVGWALDPNTASSIQVHIYVITPSGNLITIDAADKSRADIGAAYPFFGSAHGFDVSVPPAGQVCAFGINAGPGENWLLGCLG
jgi:hypothetical protein